MEGARTSGINGASDRFSFLAGIHGLPRFFQEAPPRCSNFHRLYLTVLLTAGTVSHQEKVVKMFYEAHLEPTAQNRGGNRRSLNRVNPVERLAIDIKNPPFPLWIKLSELPGRTMSDQPVLRSPGACHVLNGGSTAATRSRIKMVFILPWARIGGVASRQRWWDQGRAVWFEPVHG